MLLAPALQVGALLLSFLPVSLQEQISARRSANPLNASCALQNRYVLIPEAT